MKYADGTDVLLGDKVSIDKQYRGIVVAIIEDGLFSQNHTKEQWAYLQKGLLIDTDFGGLVHYLELDSEPIKLIQRKQNAS